MTTSDLQQIIISPPFGTYINVEWATSVTGTHTALARPGSRVLQFLKTVRPVRNGWVNKIGLINKGVEAYDYSNPHYLYSVAAVADKKEWDIILDAIPCNRMIELNVGCPNVSMAWPLRRHLAAFRLKSKLVVLKLPPPSLCSLGVKWKNLIRLAFSVGITHFHTSNTIQTKKGGQSGRAIKPRALLAIDFIKTEFPESVVIAGGGIYRPYDVCDYREAGATHFSLATIWFTPWLVPAIVKEIRS